MAKNKTEEIIRHVAIDSYNRNLLDRIRACALRSKGNIKNVSPIYVTRRTGMCVLRFDTAKQIAELKDTPLLRWIPDENKYDIHLHPDMGEEDKVYAETEAFTKRKLEKDMIHDLKKGWSAYLVNMLSREAGKELISNLRGHGKDSKIVRGLRNYKGKVFKECNILVYTSLTPDEFKNRYCRSIDVTMELLSKA